MEKDKLINEIKSSFKNVILEDGIGLWEAQGLDDFADNNNILKLRNKDERLNWENLTYKEIANCSSSIFFFDAKGMKFCLPKFLIFDILENQSSKSKELISSIDIVFTLGYKMDSENFKYKFSLLNKLQINTVIHFLEYKLNQFIENFELTDTQVQNDIEYIDLTETLIGWKEIYKRNNN